MSKTGRPQSQINKDYFERMCGLVFTQKEICTVLRVSEKTLRKFCKQTYGKGFKEVYNELIAPSKAKLRQWQFDAAEKGNVEMLKWLGVNYLGQSYTGKTRD